MMPKKAQQLVMCSGTPMHSSCATALTKNTVTTAQNLQHVKETQACVNTRGRGEEGGGIGFLLGWW